MKALIVFLMAAGCASSVVRDRSTYVAEVAFTDRLVRDGAPAVRDFVTTHCTCADNAWRTNGQGATNEQCGVYVDWWMVYTARWQWHHDMMLFNARVTNVRPPAASPLPAVTCDLPRSSP